jgi:Fe-S oxidoreductase/nitrate reductase gamma subunit
LEATAQAIGFSAYIILYVGLLAAIALFGIGLREKLDKVRKGKPDTRTERLRERIKGVVSFVGFQRRLFQDIFPGLMHAFIFWGFLVFALGYAILFLQARDYYGGIFGWLFGGRLALAYNLFVDFFAVLVIIGVIVGLIRRYIFRVKRLEINADAGFVLLLILLIMVTNLVSEAALIQLDELPTEQTAFVGKRLTGIFADASNESIRHTHIAVWWIHIGLVLGFLTYLPRSKHFHIVLGPFNVLLRNLGPYGALTKIDIEGAESYGAARPYDLTWKDLLDLLACAECGRCQDQCPAHFTEKPLSPKRLIIDLKDAFLEWPQGETGDTEAEAKEIAAEVGEDAVWACTTCRACEEHCPIFIEHVPKIVEMRRNLVLMSARFPQEVTQLFKNLEVNYNPWPIGFAKRGDWAKDLDLPVAEKGDKVDVLIWVGCAGAFDDRNKKVARSLVKVLRKAGIEPYFLGKDEKCCGDPARRLGNEYLYQTVAQENVKILNQIQIGKIVTLCPHCYNTILNEYPQFGGDYDIEHVTTFIKNLIESGKLTPRGEARETVTYHDSCYLGRYSGIYDEPREIITYCNLMVKDPDKTRSRGFCCGAGGGRMWMEESLGTRINHARIEQLKATQAKRIVTACPYCLTMFEDAIKETEETDLQVEDVCEILERCT